MNVKYRITLDTAERVQLASMVLGGKGSFRRLKRAQILLAADAGSTDEEIAKNVAVGTSTVYRTKQRFVDEGLERALSELPRPGAERSSGLVTSPSSWRWHARNPQRVGRAGPCSYWPTRWCA